MAAMMILMVVLLMAGGLGGHMGASGSHHSSEQVSHSHGRDTADTNPKQAPYSPEPDGAKQRQE